MSLLSTTLRNTIATAVIALLSAAPAWATPVEVSIVSSGSLGGFSYSVIHSATHQSGANPGYYTGGTILYNNISGNLYGNLVQSGGNWILSGISGNLVANIVGGGETRVFRSPAAR